VRQRILIVLELYKGRSYNRRTGKTITRILYFGSRAIGRYRKGLQSHETRKNKETGYKQPGEARGQPTAISAAARRTSIRMSVVDMVSKEVSKWLWMINFKISAVNRAIRQLAVFAGREHRKSCMAKVSS
jgi:hypothetical protein